MTASDKDRSAELRRIIERLRHEAEPSGLAASARNREGKAPDPADRDWAEVWGTRIGRSLGLVLLVALIVWLVQFALRGS